MLKAKEIHCKVNFSIDKINCRVYNIKCKEQVINPTLKEEQKMSNPNMEAKVKELMELKRMKEELDAEITAMEDEIKSVMGEEETLLAGAFKVTWKMITSSRFDSTRFKKEHADLAAAYTKTTTARRFCVN